MIKLFILTPIVILIYFIITGTTYKESTIESITVISIEHCLFNEGSWATECNITAKSKTGAVYKFTFKRTHIGSILTRKCGQLKYKDKYQCTHFK